MIDLGRVVAVHPEDNSVDIVMVADGARLAGVQVLAGAGASRRSGRSGLTEPTQANANDKWDRSTATDCDEIACVGYINGRQPVVIGFLFPQIAQTLFARKNFFVDRHPSDWYQTVDDAGNVEFSHPSGTFLRFAESPEHEDLTGLDFDKNWKIARNTTRAPWFSLMVKNAGVEKARLRIDPNGNVTFSHVGNLNWTTGGNMVWNVGGTMALTVNGVVTKIYGASLFEWTIGPATYLASGNLGVNSSANLSLNGDSGITGLSGGGSGSVAIVGNVSYTGTLFNNGKNIGDSHTHTGVSTGSGTSGPVS